MTDIDRSCGTCNLCCKIVAVDDLNKPAHQWCVHAVPRKGCAIYGSHPVVCQTWKCGWQTMPQLDASWKPERCGFILRSEVEGLLFIVDVDPAKPDAWRREPFYRTIKHWARESDPKRRQVVVFVGRRVIGLFPNDEIDAGPVNPDEFPALAIHFRGELGRSLVQIRTRETKEIVREVAGPWRPKAAFGVSLQGEVPGSAG
jgi:hypothetical protein